MAQSTSTVDEDWFAEWFAYGLQAIEHRLLCQTQFDAYLKEHPDDHRSDQESDEQQ